MGSQHGGGLFGGAAGPVGATFELARSEVCNCLGNMSHRRGVRCSVAAREDCGGVGIRCGEVCNCSQGGEGGRNGPDQFIGVKVKAGIPTMNLVLNRSLCKTANQATVLCGCGEIQGIPNTVLGPMFDV